MTSEYWDLMVLFVFLFQGLVWRKYKLLRRLLWVFMYFPVTRPTQICRRFSINHHVTHLLRLTQLNCVGYTAIFYTHTHIHTHTHTHAHTHTNIRTQEHTQKQTRTHKHKKKQTLTQTHTNTHTPNKHTQKHMHTQTHTRARSVNVAHNTEMQAHFLLVT